MPARKFSGSSGYRYGFNGKENDNDVKGEGNQQDYGMRIYDPRLGRFLSIDPITNQYPELTPFQFASNRPIEGIDMDGLEFIPAKGNTVGRMTMRAFGTTAQKINQRWSQSRTGRFTNGLVNTTFGTVGAIASVAYIKATGGTGAILGGSTAFMLSVGEMGVGISQMTDAIAGKHDGSTDFLHNSSTMPGLIAYGTSSQYAPFIDAFSALGPSFATSGGIKSFIKDAAGLRSAFSNFSDNQNILNALGAIDQLQDVKGFAVESVNLSNNFHENENGSKVLRSQTLSYKMSYSVQKGDDLTSIAKRLNTTVDSLSKQNNITEPNKIKEGQKLTYSNEITEKVKK